jgi:hypothetical protein
MVFSSAGEVFSGLLHACRMASKAAAAGGEEEREATGLGSELPLPQPVVWMSVPNARSATRNVCTRSMR